MITIVFGNSYSQVKGLTAETFNQLKKELSYTPDAYFSGGFSRPRYLIDNKGFFPSGLLVRVQAFLAKRQVQFATIGTPALPVVKSGLKPDFTGFTPYKAQTQAVNAAMRFSRGILAMPTGTGKSMVIALLTARHDVRTLIVVPTLEIKKQLTTTLLGVFGRTKAIRVENIDSKALQTAKDYDLLIIDEAHHVAASTYRKLNKSAWQGIRYRLMLTATPFRNQDEEQLLFEGIAGQVIYRLSYQEAVREGYIVPVEAFYLEMPKSSTDAHTWAQVYSQLVVKNEARNRLIAGAMDQIAASGASVLCLVKEVAHGKLLSDLTGVPFVHGQDEESRDYIRQFNCGGITALIGTEGVISEGVDTKPCEWVIIAALGKAKSAFMQKVGRAVRRYGAKESAKVLLIKDKSHKFCSRHYAAQALILKEEYGVVPIKLEL